MKIVVKPRRRLTETVEVELRKEPGEREYAVYRDGRKIGSVWKTSYTYSPRISKGSMIARHHSQVPCWRTDVSRMPHETRLDALAELIVLNLEVRR